MGNRAKLRFISGENPLYRSSPTVPVTQCNRLCHVTILMRVGFRVWGLGKTRHKERSKQRDSCSNRQPETTAICRINNISGAHTGPRHIAICTNGCKRACAKKVRNANTEHKYAPWCYHWPSACPAAAASALVAILDNNIVSMEPQMGEPW
jgi:hypothetical protein